MFAGIRRALGRIGSAAEPAAPMFRTAWPEPDDGTEPRWIVYEFIQEEDDAADAEDVAQRLRENGYIVRIRSPLIVDGVSYGRVEAAEFREVASGEFWADIVALGGDIDIEYGWESNMFRAADDMENWGEEGIER